MRQLHIHKRLYLLWRRSLAARRLGFRFSGTTRTKLPDSVRFNNGVTPIRYPDDRGYMSDIINIWLDDEYGIRHLPFAPHTVVDIGANIGLFSLWVRHHFPVSQIYSYEPNPRIFPITVHNLSQPGIHVFNCGVGRQSGRARMIDESDSRLASTESAPDGEIELQSFEAVLREAKGSIDLLKLDCEGAEWDILSASNLMKNVRCVRMEYHLVRNQTMSDFRDMVSKSGFIVNRVVDHGRSGIAWLER